MAITAFYSCGVITPAAAAGAPFADLRTPAGARARLLRIEFALNAATSSSVGLYRPATVGVASTTVAGQAHEPGDPASAVVVGTAWSTAPTIGTNVPLRRIVCPGTAGYPVIWDFAQMEFIIPVSSSLVLWNFGSGAASALNLTFVWSE